MHNRTAASDDSVTLCCCWLVNTGEPSLVYGRSSGFLQWIRNTVVFHSSCWTPLSWTRFDPSMMVLLPVLDKNNTHLSNTWDIRERSRIWIADQKSLLFCNLRLICRIYLVACIIVATSYIIFICWFECQRPLTVPLENLSSFSLL